MIGTLVKLLGRPLSQQVPRANAQQAATRLAHRRRLREEVDAYLAALDDEPQRRAPVQR